MVMVLAVVLLMGPAVLAQQKPAPASAQATAPKRSCPKQADQQVCERGWQSLDVAEAEGLGLRDQGMRAYVGLQVARAYTAGDKKKAIALLNDAFTATLDMADAESQREQKLYLQRPILVNMAPLAPERVEELIPQAVPGVRKQVFEALLGYYQKTKRYDAAIETINRIAGESDFPYGAASSLMGVLPEDKASEKQQLFAAALRSYRTRPPGRQEFFLGGDFLAMIQERWKGMPPALVREAIDEVLKQADSKGDPDAKPIRVTVTYRGGGNGAFSSMYDYDLFELLPILRQLDPAYAESLLKDREVLAKEFETYAQSSGKGIQSISWGNSYGSVRRTTELKADPVAHPDEALEKALAVTDAGQRVEFLLGYARVTVQKNPTAAKNFLGSTLKYVNELKSPRDEARVLTDAADLYLQLKDDMGAEKALAAGNSAVEKLYADDVDAERPNTALKAFWPSTNAWIRLVRLAGRVSPDLALGMVKETRDDEIRPVLRLAVAQAWIGISVGWITEMSRAGTAQYSDPEAGR